MLGERQLAAEWLMETKRPVEKAKPLVK